MLNDNAPEPQNEGKLPTRGFAFDDWAMI